MNPIDSPARRRALIVAGTALAAPALLLPRRAAASDAPRTLAFAHTHTAERLSLAYAAGGAYLADALARLNHFLRDHYSGTVGTIDPALFDQLFALRRSLATTQPFHVISAYRSPATNETLRRRGGGGVARSSLHLDGRAIDVRVPGVALADLRDAALDLRAGGVGYYAAPDFVHLDTGRVRRW